MVKVLLGLDETPTPHDAADALAVAICHVHQRHGRHRGARSSRTRARPACAAGGTIVREAVPPSSPPYRGMIARLSGTLVDKGPSRIVVDVGGVGYDVQIPLSTFYPLGEAGSRVELRVHTHVREDALALYGFATPLEHNLFERLISINGVGPKLALAVLSGIEPAELIRAVREPGRGAADQDSRRRQEDGGADRTRVEGSTAGDPRSSNGIHGGRRTTRAIYCQR